LEAAQAAITTANGGFQVQFIQFDLTHIGWTGAARLGLELSGAGKAYDYVLAFAALHHIPGQERRLNILRHVAGLLHPGGRFIHSHWQFLNSPRLAARLQPWERIGLEPADVDPGDYLLDWRAGGEGLRYVHHFSEAELAALAAETGFTLLDSFYSDGEGGKLGLYQVWEKGL
jgi:SAM-dependent methyltransferase